MKKLFLSVIGMYLNLLAVFSQTTDSSQYKNRKLHLDEINFVSGYYRQNGNHSAVTGGIGTEKLTDFSNTIELKFTGYDKKHRKKILTAEAGFDFYTSASSDKIDPYTISSASSRDGRFYPSLSYTVENEKKKRSLGVTGSFSTESDYVSYGIGTNFSKTSADESREVIFKLQAYLDHWFVILPVELRRGTGRGWDNHYPTEPRNSFTASANFLQIINPELQLSLIAEPTYQQGLLATKYQRVYFNNGAIQSENLRNHRLKLPLSIRANYFPADRFIVHCFYRYYTDDWGLHAHTIDVEIPYKINPFFSLSPYYRFYTQNAIRDFAPYQMHLPGELYFTSDYDLSEFTSNYFGLGFRLAPPHGLFNKNKLSSIELRYGHYKRSDGLHADQISMHLKLK